MKTSTRDSFVKKNPFAKGKTRTQNEMCENFKIPSVTTINSKIKYPQQEEDEFWKDCIDINSNLSK